MTDELALTISNAGRVDIRPFDDTLYNIEKFIPKRPGHFVPRFKCELRSCGIYISGPHIFEYIKRLNRRITEGEFTDVPVRSLILKEGGKLGCPLPGAVFDIGNPAGYKYCVDYFRKINSMRAAEKE